MKRLLLCLFIGVFCLSSCTLFAKKPILIEHEPYTLSVDNLHFENAKCYNSPAICLPPDLLKVDPPIESLSTVPTDFGGLSPRIPIAKALTFNAFDLDMNNFIYAKRCLSSTYVRYVVFQNDEYRLLSSVADLADIYASIDSPEEAYSYAIAATGYTPLFDLNQTPGIKLDQDQVEETFVTSTETGYSVHLFNTFICGCGPHIIESLDVLVYRDGTIEITNKSGAFHNPAIDDVCAD